jgi:hypothetical protein
MATEKKHTPERDHDRKSAAKKKKRFARKAAQKRNEAMRAWGNGSMTNSLPQYCLGNPSASMSTQVWLKRCDLLAFIASKKPKE